MRSYIGYNRALARQYDQWMKAMHYAEHTQIAYRKVVRRFIEFAGKKSVASVTHLDVRAFVGHISEEGASLGTAYSSLGVLRLFYDFLNLGGVVSYVAPRFVRLRRPIRNNKPSLTEWQVKQLVLATKTLRERALIELFYATGCRLNEVRLLRIEDLDFDTRTARVHGKFGKVRTAFLTRSAIDALRAYIRTRKRGIIFQQDYPAQKGCLYTQNGRWLSQTTRYIGPNARAIRACRTIGRVDLMPYDVAKKRHAKNLNRRDRNRPARHFPLSKVGIQNIVKLIARRAGIKRVTPHVFRHTFATHLYDHGAAVEIIKALMGHVWIHTTMQYAHISPDKIANTFEQCHPRPKLGIPDRGPTSAMAQ